MSGMSVDQQERRRFLIRALLRETAHISPRDVEMPAGEKAQKELLRALFNVRPPRPASTEFLKVQDAYLQEEIRLAGVTRAADLEPVRERTYLWRGDITTLECAAIVNAANQDLLGCFIPNHHCIDNAIHTFAGVQLRLECSKIMHQQGYPEPTGGAKITHAYNLPCRRVLHTVGPVVTGEANEEDDRLLASCYESCLDLADRNGLDSVAFCCISTGVFHFPAVRAARVAVGAVDEHRRRTHSRVDVIFNVFTEEDEKIYQDILKGAAR